MIPVIFLSVVQSLAQADRFTYIDSSGKTTSVEARLAGSGQGTVAFETADGQIHLIPQVAIQERVESSGPQPLDAPTMIDTLRKRFGRERFRSLIHKPYSIGLVLATPLHKKEEARARIFLKKAGRFFHNVDGHFLRFAKKVHIKTRPLRYPLVVLIFEDSTDFEQYARKATGGRGLSAGRIAGFYSEMTNYLAVRLSECRTFAVPLHEAVHQQVYNRGVLQRIAPIPAWFNEGIATGFEGNGERIRSGPTRISAEYARRWLRANRVDWTDIVSDDKVFRGDVLAGEAYANAWGLHWLLLTKHRDGYSRYLQMLGRKKTLAAAANGERSREFQNAFHVSVAELQRRFPRILQSNLKRQKISIVKKPRRGISLTHSNLGEVSLTAVSRGDLGGALQVGGRLKNTSPLRAMTFHVRVVTDTGTYADWLVSNVPINRTASLRRKFAQKLMQNAPGGPSTTFRVLIKSAPIDSKQARNWQRGKLPAAVYQRRP